jgi:hypothetical protein
MKVLVEWSGQRMVYDEVDQLMHDDDAANFPMVRMTFKAGGRSAPTREDRLFDPAQANIQILPTEAS